MVLLARATSWLPYLRLVRGPPPLLPHGPAQARHNDIAGQHGSDLVLDLQGFVGQRRVAGPEDKRRLHVDLGNDARALAIETLGDAENGLIKADRKHLPR